MGRLYNRALAERTRETIGQTLAFRPRWSVETYEVAPRQREEPRPPRHYKLAPIAERLALHLRCLEEFEHSPSETFHRVCRRLGNHPSTARNWLHASGHGARLNVRHACGAVPPFIHPHVRADGSELTARRRQIACLFAQGLWDVEIAQRLGLSRRTVDNMRTSIYKRLRIHDVTALVRYCLARGWIENEFVRKP